MTVFVTKLAIGRQVSAILPGAVFWWIRKQRGYLSDNVGSEVRWRTRLRFYGADKKLITERGTCLFSCLFIRRKSFNSERNATHLTSETSELFISWSTSPTVGLACIHVTYGPEHPESMSTTPFVSYPLLWTARYHRSRSRDQEIIMTLVVFISILSVQLRETSIWSEKYVY